MKKIFFLFSLSLFAILALPVLAQTLAQQLSGKILLQVEEHGEGWYVYPENLQRYYLGRPADAFELMRKLGLGISNANLSLIPESGSSSAGDLALRRQLSGKILLQVEENGEAWYIYPDDLKRYYLGRPDDAFQLMRQLGLGISNENLLAISVSSDSAAAPNNGNSSNGKATEGVLNDEYTQSRLLILQKINAERASQGLAAYTLIKEVSLGAQAAADDMTARNYFEFASPEGIEIQDRLNTESYVVYAVAQNLLQTNQGAANVVSVWKEKGGNSYANLLEDEYEDVGIGIGTYQDIPFYLVVFARSLESHFNEQTAGLDDLNQVRNEMLALVNQERADQGLSPLVMNALLHESAQGHADDMLSRSYYGHETPEGITPHTRITGTGYDAMKSAENIAKGQFSVQEVMDAWINSPDHRANLLGNFEEAGFGLAYGKNQNGYEVIWVQNFGTAR